VKAFGPSQCHIGHVLEYLKVILDIVRTGTCLEVDIGMNGNKARPGSPRPSLLSGGILVLDVDSKLLLLGSVGLDASSVRFDAFLTNGLCSIALFSC
jgi:hypothetical protein